ncbi:c-type cytochrome [Polaromonas sp. YR568]|uniref:c-type cytochrome n=1 Tax=Polaromonas sp. YR568 TaxID=1855301 RepID=UPI00398BF11C
MPRLILLVLGILGAGLCSPAWAGENIRAFASELLAFESRQVLLPEPPPKYSDSENGANLRKLLDPVRASNIVDEYFDGLAKNAAEPEVPKLIQPLLARYEKAFAANPRAYEEEYLDALNWSVLVVERGVRTSALASAQAPPSASVASKEEQAAIQKLAESLRGLSNSILGLLAGSIRDKVAKGVFSDAGAKRALEMADRLSPTVAGVAAAMPEVPAQTRTRQVASGEEVYRAQCIACHATGVAGSPKQGDVEAWAPRIRSGLASMLQSTIKGKGVMPSQAGGDFQELELARAVAYLANTAGGKFAEPPLPAGHPGTVTVKIRPPPAPRPPALPYAAMNANQKMVLGERTYQANCAACHQANGRGAGPIPDLHKASTFAKTDSVIGVVLHGSKNSAMPAWRALQDEEIAEVINYVRFKFSSELVEFVTPEEVRSRRR